MSNRGKLPVILLILLIMVSLSLVGGVFYLLQKERARNLALQGELEEIKTRLKVTETNLQDYKKKSSDLEVKLQLAEENINKLNSGLQEEKTAKQEALAKIDQLKTDLEQQKALRSDLEKKFNQAQKDVEGIQAQLKELGSKKAELEAKVKDLEERSQGVELGKIVVNPETQPSAQPPVEEAKAKPQAKAKTQKALVPALEGKVLVVNRDYNFAVINVGSKDGVGIDNVFSVYHDNKYIGDVKIEKVHDSMAAADFITSGIKDKINENDRVVRKGK